MKMTTYKEVEENMEMNEIYCLARKSLDRDLMLYIGGKRDSRNISINPFVFEDKNNEFEEEKKLLQTILVQNNFYLFRNGIILSEYEIPDKFIPVFRNTTRKIEINRFGDIINSLHAYNIDQIAEKNPLTIFEVRTKRNEYFDYFNEKNVKIVRK